MQSKRGWIWSRNVLGEDTWTATLRFRVSGQGKRLFGDGFALWFTQNKFHVDGSIHGFTDKFTGARGGVGLVNTPSRACRPLQSRFAFISLRMHLFCCRFGLVDASVGLPCVLRLSGLLSPQ